jgi:uncharacterized cupredoxin-like copper-binding protein
MHRTIRLGAVPALGLAAALLLAACGGTAAPTTPAPATPPPGVELSVTGTEFAFTPDAYTVTAGESVTITLVNGGAVEHDFSVDALNVRVHADVGKTTSETFTGFAAGTYEVYCSIPGHKQAGMVAELVVE